MNIRNYIYPRLMNIKNYRVSKPDTHITILPCLLEHPKWQAYKIQTTITYIGMLKFLTEMAFVTNLAYTYYLNGEEEIEISPYYIESLYRGFNNVNLREAVPQNRRTIEIIRASKIAHEYIEIVNPGGFCTNHKGDYDKRFTRYRVTPLLKILASSFANNPDMYDLDIAHIVEQLDNNKSRAPLEKFMRYVFSDGYICKDWGHARLHLRKYPGVTMVKNAYGDHIIIRSGGFSTRSFKEFDLDNELVAEMDVDRFKYPVEKSNNVFINRKNLYDIICSIETRNLAPHIIEELLRIWKNTSDDNPVYHLDYYRTKEGRYYAMNTSFQMLPKKIRRRILADYNELDIKCSIFSIYKNLAKLYKYKKAIPEIESLVSDPKAYRQQFVTDDFSYDDVKTILTALAFGAKCDEYSIGVEAYDIPDLPIYHKSALLEAVANKRAVFEFVQNDKIRALYKELRGLGKHIIKKSLKKGNKNILVNVIGNELELSRKVSFGKRMAHIYQSWESVILNALDSLDVNGCVLSATRGAVGLYLHDGVYIHKDITNRVESLPELASEWVQKKLGIEIEYDMK